MSKKDKVYAALKHLTKADLIQIFGFMIGWMKTDEDTYLKGLACAIRIYTEEKI